MSKLDLPIVKSKPKTYEYHKEDFKKESISPWSNEYYQKELSNAKKDLDTLSRANIELMREVETLKEIINKMSVESMFKD